jgi:hypothetical protein
MNTLDMFTREKANQIHLKEMHQEAKERRLLHQAKQGRSLEGIVMRRKLQFTIAFATLVMIFGSFLIAMRF